MKHSRYTEEQIIGTFKELYRQEDRTGNIDGGAPFLQKLLWNQ